MYMWLRSGVDIDMRSLWDFLSGWITGRDGNYIGSFEWHSIIAAEHREK